MIPCPPEKWVSRSPNYTPAHARVIRRIILHDTASHTAQSALAWFGRPDSRVSAHVVIDRDGTIYRVVLDEHIAWHARGANRDSLGVELVDMTDDPYPRAQMAACLHWVASRCALYGIPPERVLGHCDVSVPPGRKTDPGPDFPWAAFRGRLTEILVAGISREVS